MASQSLQNFASGEEINKQRNDLELRSKIEDKLARAAAYREKMAAALNGLVGR